jgi:hypothetical protein
LMESQPVFQTGLRILISLSMYQKWMQSITCI